MSETNASRDQMKIGLFLEPSGRHVTAWRHDAAHPEAATSLENFIAVARLAEAAKLDFLFIADNNNTWDENIEYFKRNEKSATLDPLMVFASLASATGNIGLISTVSTTYMQPYHVARFFASLDQLTRGRAGWNVVTSMYPGEAKNFGGVPHPDHAKRYERAEEFVDVVTGLWKSFDRDAYLRDKESGIYVDAGKMHLLNHEGRYFSVRGPLNIPPSRQRHPVVVQAGSSESGRELAARTADVVFVANQTMEEAQAFYADTKQRMRKYGRDERAMKIMPGISPVIASTEAEAHRKFQDMQDRIPPEVGVALLSTLIGGFDLSGYPVDGPLPDMPLTAGAQGRQQVLVDMARRENLSIRQVYQRASISRGHWQPIGTPEMIADLMEERFRNKAADGFNLMTQVPTDLADFKDQLIPVLQQRGLFRTEYEGSTLRDNLGIQEFSTP